MNFPNALSRELAKNKFLKSAKSRGFTVVGTYIRAVTPVEVICPEGHASFPLPSNFTHKTKPTGCSVCARINRFKKGRLKASVPNKSVCNLPM